MPARALAVLVLALAAVAGCGPTATTPSPTPSETAPPSAAVSTPFAFPLVTVETRGGECPEGSCGRLLNIEADGRLHEVIPKDRVVGTVPTYRGEGATFL